MRISTNVQAKNRVMLMDYARIHRKSFYPHRNIRGLHICFQLKYCIGYTAESILRVAFYVNVTKGIRATANLGAPNTAWRVGRWRLINYSSVFSNFWNVFGVKLKVATAKKINVNSIHMVTLQLTVVHYRRIRNAQWTVSGSFSKSRKTPIGDTT